MKIWPRKANSLYRLIRFAERAEGLEIREKLKLLLYLNNTKPNAEVILKVDSKDLEEKSEFEKLLKENHKLFLVSPARSYEEIKKIKNNKIIWEIEGTYYIYDLFKNKNAQEVFKKYLALLDQGKRPTGDLIAGKHYHYPSCCVFRFIKETKEEFLKNNYTYESYYKKQQDLDHKFPFVFHRPCSLKCPRSIKLNKKYETALKKISKKTYEEYSEQYHFKGKLLVGEISDIECFDLPTIKTSKHSKRTLNNPCFDKDSKSSIEIKNKSIWPKKTGGEYELIFKKPFRKHYYLVSFLSKKNYQKGQLLKGEVILQYDYAKVKILKEKKKILKDLHHERRLPLLGEVTFK